MERIDKKTMKKLDKYPVCMDMEQFVCSYEMRKGGDYTVYDFTNELDKIDTGHDLSFNLIHDLMFMNNYYDLLSCPFEKVDIIISGKVNKKILKKYGKLKKVKGKVDYLYTIDFGLFYRLTSVYFVERRSIGEYMTNDQSYLLLTIVYSKGVRVSNKRSEVYLFTPSKPRIIVNNPVIDDDDVMNEKFIPNKLLMIINNPETNEKEIVWLMFKKDNKKEGKKIERKEKKKKKNRNKKGDSSDTDGK